MAPQLYIGADSVQDVTLPLPSGLFQTAVLDYGSGTQCVMSLFFSKNPSVASLCPHHAKLLLAALNTLLPPLPGLPSMTRPTMITQPGWTAYPLSTAPLPQFTSFSATGRVFLLSRPCLKAWLKPNLFHEAFSGSLSYMSLHSDPRSHTALFGLCLKCLLFSGLQLFTYFFSYFPF